MTKNRYCWTWGVCGWGLTTAVTFALVMSLSDDKPFLPYLLLSLIMFPPGGYLWGLIMWHWFGSKMRKGQPDEPAQ